jgi:lipoxygenase
VSFILLQKETSLEKKRIKGYVHLTNRLAQEVKYEAEFDVPNNFGDIGAILVENEHRREMFIKNIVLDGFLTGPVNFSCDSWVHSKHDNPTKRVIFSNKVESLPHLQKFITIFVLKIINNNR